MYSLLSPLRLYLRLRARQIQFNLFIDIISKMKKGASFSHYNHAFTPRAKAKRDDIQSQALATSLMIL